MRLVWERWLVGGLSTPPSCPGGTDAWFAPFPTLLLSISHNLVIASRRRSSRSGGGDKYLGTNNFAQPGSRLEPQVPHRSREASLTADPIPAHRVETAPSST